MEFQSTINTAANIEISNVIPNLLMLLDDNFLYDIIIEECSITNMKDIFVGTHNLRGGCC